LTSTKKILEDLRLSREKGNSGPDAPVTFEKMAKAYASRGWDTTEDELRTELQRLFDMGVPIKFVGDGVFHMKKSEVAEEVAHLSAEIKRMELRRDMLGKSLDDILEHPRIKELAKEFETVVA
jgi:hypothetical protein